MAKYVYISFIMWMKGMSMELFVDKIMPNLENDEVKLLHGGVPYGVLEDTVLIHETDLELDSFRIFRRDACTVDGKSWIDHARTVPTTPFT